MSENLLTHARQRRGLGKAGVNPGFSGVRVSVGLADTPSHQEMSSSVSTEQGGGHAAELLGRGWCALPFLLSGRGDRREGEVWKELWFNPEAWWNLICVSQWQGPFV